MKDKTKNNKVLVAMSGGVDSSVAAALLKSDGYNVTGAFMKNWSDPDWPCPWAEDRADAMRVCLKLGIPFETWDFTKEYKAKVVDYMTREYARGRTPNPDVMCNREIKFGLFFDKATELGFDYIATGHYVRKIKNQKSNLKNYVLAKARDLNKDQSYFLWTLKQEQIAKCLFPIGEIESKAKVREIAREYDLPVADKKDSQGICFMGPVDVAEFIKPYVKTTVGDIVTTSGQKIGTHGGLDFLTIGQRKGIGIGGTGPYYVSQKDYETNTLVVASSADQIALESSSLIASGVNLIQNQPSMSQLSLTHAKKNGSIEIQAAIRYRQEPVPATLTLLASGQCLVAFDHPVRAITPGQSVVFYQGEELLGGGTID